MTNHRRPLAPAHPERVSHTLAKTVARRPALNVALLLSSVLCAATACSDSGDGNGGGAAGSSGSAGSGGGSNNTSLAVDLYQGFHAEETCGNAQPSRQECLDTCTETYDSCNAAPPVDPTEPPLSCEMAYQQCQSSCPSSTAETPSCIYADVYFLVTCDDASVHDLTPDDVEVIIGERNVGVEGSVLLTQENGMQVDLLLDRSYSITAANAQTAVRNAADGFLEALPDEARVRVSAFASEASVPQMLGSSGDNHYYEVGSERSALESMVTTQYSPYASESSVAFTKLFDAAVGLAETATPSDTSLAALPSVAVIFTDGSDTASTRFSSAESARTQITTVKPTMKVYAIGLGNEIDGTSLRTLSQDRFYSADSDALANVFQEVASELGAIYRYRVLVPSAAQQAAGKLTVNYCGETSVTEFTMGSIGSPATIPGGANSCRYANDNECDEPNLCPSGTDSADCDGAPPTGENSCRWAFDNECDEPNLCPLGTDSADCR